MATKSIKLPIIVSNCLFLIVSLLILIGSIPCFSAELRVAVASNFIEPARALSQEFDKKNHTISLISGSSGKLFLQISKGAPFDLYLSADSVKPHTLVEQGLAQRDTLKTYATGKLGIWFSHCPLTANARQQLLSSQLSPNVVKQLLSVRKIAIANPALAPYGMASKQYLITSGLWDQVEDRLVYPENISQVAQLAKLGVVETAFIALSQTPSLQTLSAKRPNQCVLGIATEHHSAISQQLVVLNSSKNNELARRFADFLSSKKAQDLIKNMGYK
jgi:molybdate transport system substrate-binding protein